MHRAGWMRVRNAFKPAAVRRQSTKASVGDGGAKAGIGDGGEPLHTKGGGGGEAGNGSGESTEGPPVVIPGTLAGIAMWIEGTMCENVEGMGEDLAEAVGDFIKDAPYATEGMVGYVAPASLPQKEVPEPPNWADFSA
ncbi:uncharacterized protein LOC119330374 [Triticum dicoccoides]|uniref:uncharacterized protein LOC119330374 n=1 Tax=Triticum dicoccoides TaxID=85692 RepID=UPI001890D369|nr:uncharacterized protein LOC119330374 [Triticum dicoccoides]